GDMLKGAIIGGIIGNNVTKNVDNGGAVGALIGGIIGHNNSNATAGTQRVCNVQTRYNEESVTVYSHSVVTFYHEGKQYKLRFQK
ncbi:MAG: glycine zipper 2TM domain-containing protein, partial [Alteromonas sp.]